MAAAPSEITTGPFELKQLMKVSVTQKALDPGSVKGVVTTLQRLVKANRGIVLVRALKLRYGEWSRTIEVTFGTDGETQTFCSGGGSDEARQAAACYRLGEPIDRIAVRCSSIVLTGDERLQNKLAMPGAFYCGKLVKIADPESRMAIALFHELLHLWFVRVFCENNAVDPELATGHDASGCRMHDAFRERLFGFYGDMEKIEAEIYPSQPSQP